MEEDEELAVYDKVTGFLNFKVRVRQQHLFSGSSSIYYINLKYFLFKVRVQIR